MSGTLCPFPDPEAARAAIGKIQALDLRMVSIEEIRELLIPVCRGCVVNAPRFKPGLRLFRMRICGKPNHISELSYPPSHLTPLGRANRAEDPVLYCSTLRSTPFFESRPTEGQTVALAHWITTAPLLSNHVGYSDAIFKGLRSNRPHAGWGPEPAEVPGSDPNRFVAEFLAGAFAKRVPEGSEHEYKLSAAIAEGLFKADIFDGLLYPTVPMRANADNLAIKPRYADNHLRFLKAEFARIDNARDFAFDVTVLDTATALAPDGTIVWKGRLDQWVLRKGDQLTLTAENGE